MARAELFAFFSRLWVKELDAGFCSVLDGALGRALLPGFHESDEASLLTGAICDREAAFDSDFAHLTVVTLAPYESFFLREDGMMEAGAANPAVDFMRRYGFEVDLAAARALAPDHLGIELEFMSELCRREGGALEARNGPAVDAVRKVQRDFLDGHLLRWAPLYCFSVQRTARTRLYREAADATLQLLFTVEEQFS